jgi:hypothetical protein
LSIHTLDDDSLLNVIYLYRPAVFGGDNDDISSMMAASMMDPTEWRWWCKLTHVCRRWRNLILGSASYLGISLVCTYDTPVADMLAHSPPLPIIIDFIYSTAAEDDEGIILAFERRDRVRSVRLRMLFPNLQNLIMTIDGEYPALEYLTMEPMTDKDTALMLPETFQTPRLRYLALRGINLPTGPRFLTTATGLVTLSLSTGRPSSYFQPSILLQWLSFIPQLEELKIAILYPVSNSDVESQLMHAPIMTSVTLPNLRCFEFRCASAYMEAVVRRIAAPRLGKLDIQFEQLAFFVPSLSRFTNTSENLKFDSAKFNFSGYQIDVRVYLREAEVYVLSIKVHNWDLGWPPTSLDQVFNSLSQISQIFSTVEHLTLEHERSFTLLYEVDRTEWRKLLWPFRNVKTLRVDGRLVEEFSRSLPPDDGEHPLELLPELQELTYSGVSDNSDAFTSFIDIRQNAGRPVTLVRPGSRTVTPLVTPLS